jgi:hypothetical protein
MNWENANADAFLMFITYAEDRAFRAFNDHPNPGTNGQLLAALRAYRDCLIENGYMKTDPREMAPDLLTDVAERAALVSSVSDKV